MWNPLRPDCLPVATPRHWPKTDRSWAFPAKRPWARFALIFPAQIRPIISRQILLSIYFRRLKIRRATGNCGTRKFAGARWTRSGYPIYSLPHMSELAQAIERYLAALRAENSSPHTLRNYESDLKQFLDYFSPPQSAPPASAAITALDLREWMGSLYDRGLDAISIRRKLAAVRSLFHFLAREGAIVANPARLVRTPKAARRVPSVPTAEQTNVLVNGIGEDRFNRPHPERDLLLFELLYGCGLRISELVGLNLED